MRAYRKRTHHPFCIYLTRDEARALEAEAQWSLLAGHFNGGKLPQTQSLRSKLTALLADPKRGRA